MLSFKVQDKIDHWFRQEYTRVLSLFLARYGADKIELIEDAIQEALFKAMQVWSYQDSPDNPSAWIYKVAQNKLLDQFRKKQLNQDHLDEPNIEQPELDNSEIKDETLKLLFACCHPELKSRESIILCLKFAAGLGLNEISRALFTSYEATKKNFQRAKKHFKENNLDLAIPGNELLKPRLQRVFKVILLMFTEGYRPSQGDKILKDEVCFEALRLATTLYQHELMRNSQLYALIALMCFKSARIEARTHHNNRFISLKDQDRTLWSPALIQKGNEFFTLALAQNNQSEYHFHAAVESQYVNVKSFDETDWNGLLNIYNYWRQISKSPALELNRIVVVMQALGPEEALDELQNNCKSQKNHLFYSIKGEIFLKLKEYDQAISCFEQAIKFSHNSLEQDLIMSKIEMARGR